MQEGGAVGEGEQLREGVGAVGALYQGCVAGLRVLWVWRGREVRYWAGRRYVVEGWS